MKTINNMPIFYRNQGIAMIIGVISLIAVVALTTVAMHAGNLMLNKTRLQNAVDAAALSAAKVWHTFSDPVAAENAAKETFKRHLLADGGVDLAPQSEILTGEGHWELSFLSSLDPVTVEADPLNPGDILRFVRVRIFNAPVSGLLARIYGINTIDMSVSAVSGPSAALVVTACNLTPMLVCGDPNDHGDTDGDGSSDKFYGFEEGQVHMLKLGPHSEDQPLGSGNFHLLNLPDSQGANDVKYNLAGETSGCLMSGETVETQTGVAAGPVAHGLNTRFGTGGNQLDPEDYPPDIVKTNPNSNQDDGGYDAYTADNFSTDLPNAYLYEQYQSDVVSCLGDQSQAFCNDPGALGRRVISVVMGDCPDDVNGNTHLNIYGFGCFFLPQSVNLQGNQGHVEVFGEFVAGCNNEGGFSPENNGEESGNYPSEIILYKDPQWNDA